MQNSLHLKTKITYNYNNLLITSNYMKSKILTINKLFFKEEN